jgi:CheY-like chemotaxis protein
MTILCIDDDGDDQEIFKDCLTSIDPSIKLLMALTADEAFEVLKHDTPDYIFLDDGMPKMTGRDFLTELKVQRKKIDIPIIVCSTELSTYAKRDYDQLNLVQKFLKKPNTFEGLCDAIREIIKK